jgi:hypothetical protein
MRLNVTRAAASFVNSEAKATAMNPYRENFRFVMPDDAALDEKILNIYWYKKELEEFLPQIATYATPVEIANITLSQLSIMEKQLVKILSQLAREENAQRRRRYGT